MVNVLAIITTQPGLRDTVLEAFRANMPAVHAEDGCIEYAPAIDAQGLSAHHTALGPDTFVVIEKWASPAEQRAHFDGKQRDQGGASARDRRRVAARTGGTH